jgi:hypothetical protein
MTGSMGVLVVKSGEFSFVLPANTKWFRSRQPSPHGQSAAARWERRLHL